MSDIKIQNSSPDELPGGQKPLASDNADRKSTHGGNFNQVLRSFPPAPNVEPGSAGLCSPAPNSRPIEDVNAMFVSAPVTVRIKPVDSRTVEGSYPGDHRAKAAPAVMPNQPAPRSAVGQAPAGGRIPAAPAPQSFPGNLADSDSGN
jgi:hypothetical protein